jgi:hypothetical protein
LNPDTADSSARPHPAVVRIVAPENGSQALGSGTLVYATGQHGLIITNWHVVRAATGPVQVLFADGFRSAGTVMKVDKAWDLAVIGIWRPMAQPVGIATEPPGRGDVLTIAGYGSGQYRAIQGRCTQYVAPGKDHPSEMIELSAEARQGDSGGPIFNSRGELAGVLLGAQKGRTVGSYCGRVQVFLADARRVLDREQQEAIARGEQQPERNQDQDIHRLPRHQLADLAEPEVIARRSEPSANALLDVFVARDDVTADTPSESSPEPASAPPAQRQLAELGPPPNDPASVRPPAVAAIEQQRQDEFFRPSVTPQPPQVTQAVPMAVPPQADGDAVLRLTDVIGETPGAQIKSILAAIGVLSLVIFASRLMRGDN